MIRCFFFFGGWQRLSCWLRTPSRKQRSGRGALVRSGPVDWPICACCLQQCPIQNPAHPSLIAEQQGVSLTEDGEETSAVDRANEILSGATEVDYDE